MKLYFSFIYLAHYMLLWLSVPHPNKSQPIKVESDTFRLSKTDSLDPGWKSAAAAAAAAKSLQSCPTLCDPRDGSPPGSPGPGILQARTLEWVAISFSNAGKWKVKVKSLSRVPTLSDPWTAAYQAPPSMGFSRQEYWSGLPLPSPAESLPACKCLWEETFQTEERPTILISLFSRHQC